MFLIGTYKNFNALTKLCHHHRHSDLSQEIMTVSFGSDQIPSHNFALSLPLPGIPVNIQFLQVSFYSMSAEPLSTLIAFALTCTSLLRFICISMPSIDGRPACLNNTSMLVILSFHEMFIMVQRCLILYAWSFFACTL